MFCDAKLSEIKGFYKYWSETKIQHRSAVFLVREVQRVEELVKIQNPDFS